MDTWIIPYEQYFSGAEFMAMTSLTILERETSIHKSKKAASFWLLGQHSTTTLHVYPNTFMQHIKELFGIYIYASWEWNKPKDFSI